MQTDFLPFLADYDGFGIAGRLRLSQGRVDICLVSGDNPRQVGRKRISSLCWNGFHEGSTCQKSGRQFGEQHVG